MNAALQSLSNWYVMYSCLIVCTANSAYKNVVFFRSGVRVYVINLFTTGNQEFGAASPVSVLFQSSLYLKLH